MSLNLTTYFLETCNIHPLQYSGKIALTYDTRYVRIMIIFRQKSTILPQQSGYKIIRTMITLDRVYLHLYASQSWPFLRQQVCVNINLH